MALLVEDAAADPHDLHSIPRDTRALHLLVSDKNMAVANLRLALGVKTVQSGVVAGYRLTSLMQPHMEVLQFQKSE